MADIILILVLCLFVYIGYKKGFAKTLVNASANVVSVVFGVLFTNPVAQLIFKSPIGESVRNSAMDSLGKGAESSAIKSAAVSVAADSMAMVVSSVISFILVTVLVRIAIGLIAGAVNIVAKLPLIQRANHILGAVIGGISGSLICYVVIGFLFVLSESGIMQLDGIVESIDNSILCSFVYYNNVIGNALSSVL